jgi:peptidoglycan/xylan/chitin deacetylase (PgdA/CDA1 family)
MVKKALNRYYSRAENRFAGRMIRCIYFSLLKSKEFLGYKTKRKLNMPVVVLTFDDIPDKNSMQIPRYLAKHKISATFFVPACTEDHLLKDIVALGHELGGHGWSHEKSERQDEYKNAREIFARLRKFDKNAISWRFPWLSYTAKSIDNVKAAGFSIDSSVGTFFPQNCAAALGSMHEIKFLRLPTKYWMDLDGDQKLIRRFILRKTAKEKGIIVLPFHIYEQEKNFDDFCIIIQELQNKGMKFYNLRDAHNLIK